MLEVTIPLTLPVVAVAALFGAILTFTDMTMVYVLTRGGPTNATQVLCWPPGRSSAGSRAATWPRGRRWPCSCSRCSWPRPSPSCGPSGAWRCCEMAAAVPDAAGRAGTEQLRRRYLLARVGVYLAAVLAALVCAAPFLWSLVTTFKHNRDLYNPENNPFIFNRATTPDHVLYLLRDTAFLTFIWNTLWVGLVVVAITLALGLPPPTPSPRSTAPSRVRWPSPSSSSTWCRRACCSCRCRGWWSPPACRTPPGRWCWCTRPSPSRCRYGC
jgi:hypothetical protein